MNSNTFLIDRYYQTQEHRLALAGQIRALKEANESYDTVEHFYEQFYTIEKELAKYIAKEVKKYPIWNNYLKGVKGIGPITGLALLVTLDASRADHASSFWKYAGLACDDNGDADKRKKGEKISWNPFLKKTCWLISNGFIKCKGKYRGIYETSKEYYQVKFPKEVPVKGTKIIKYTKGHIHAMALRRAVKLFLAELWVKMREEQGLPVSEPFAHRVVPKNTKKTTTAKRVKKK